MNLVAILQIQYATPHLTTCPRPLTLQGTEFVHLPAIVESAESSPNAAKEAAYRIRKLLSDPAATPGYVQYNALMLVRILIDNPGHTFTRNLDAKFVSTTKDLLRNGRDMGVQHFLRETLNALEAQRSWDEDLRPLVQMWAKEKDKLGRVNSSVSGSPASLCRRQSSSPPGGRCLRHTHKISVGRLSDHRSNRHFRRPMSSPPVYPRRKRPPNFLSSSPSRLR